MTRDTLSTLDLHAPGKVTWIRHVRHHQVDGRVDVRPGECVFSAGPHHGHYGYAVESDQSPEPIALTTIHRTA